MTYTYVIVPYSGCCNAIFVSRRDVKTELTGPKSAIRSKCNNKCIIVSVCNRDEAATGCG